MHARSARSLRVRLTAAALGPLVVIAVLRTTPAHAHAERTHGIAVMLAFRYLAHRAAEGDVSAQLAVDYWAGELQQVADEANADPLGPIVLGFEPGTTVDPSEAAPAREEPGLSGPLAPGDGGKELPTGTGALLGGLTAAVDDHNDVWADAKSPFQFVMEKFDDELGNVGGAMITAWAEFLFGGPPSATGCEGDGFWTTLGCALLDLFVFLLVAPAAPLGLMVAGVLGVFSDDIHETIAEDVVSGCHFNLIVDEVVDQQFGDYPDQIIGLLKHDENFYQALGIETDTCDLGAELLEDIGQFRTYGSPSGLPEALFTIRARLADFILACDAAGGTDVFDDDMIGDLEECAEDPALIAAHFRTLDPWALSTEGTELMTGNPDHVKRWRHGHNFTMLTHFEDVLSPADGAAIDFSDPSVVVGVMKTSRGALHPLDGFSLGAPARRFAPLPAKLSALAPEDVAWLGGAAGEDDTILNQGADFELRATVGAIGHLILRRRVCADGVAGLKTDDELGDSQCGAGGAVPDSYADERLGEEIFPPAELGALDGFTRWAHGDLSAELVDSVTQTSYTYYDWPLSFALLFQDGGGAIPSSGPLNCGLAIDCAGNRARWASTWNDLFADGAPSREGLRLKGLALALHMIQDMTVPHHIAPTTAYGHQDYESWFSAWLFPTGKILLEAPGIRVNTDTGSYQRKVTAEVPNRWQVAATDSGGAPKTTDALWTEVTDLIDADGAGSNSFWAAVDQSWDQLEDHMSSLVDGSDCEGEFSVRALARSVAFETARATMSEGRKAEIDGLTASERARSGFWIISAIGAIEESQVETNGAEFIEVAPWRAVGSQTLPVLVAATARLLLEGARAREDASTTCDDGEDSGPPLDGTTSAEVTALSCEEVRRQEILACFEAPNGPGCAQYVGIPAYDSCAGPAGPYANDGCGDAALNIAGCACAASQATPLDDDARRRVDLCLVDRRRSDRVRDLERSGEVDHVTALFLGGHLPAASDRDRDGIPDGADACPGESAAQGKWPGTALEVGVCWRRASAAGQCNYGCPVAAGEGDRN